MLVSIVWCRMVLFFFVFIEMPKIGISFSCREILISVCFIKESFHIWCGYILRKEKKKGISTRKRYLFWIVRLSSKSYGDIQTGEVWSPNIGIGFSFPSPSLNDCRGEIELLTKLMWARSWSEFLVFPLASFLSESCLL